MRKSLIFFAIGIFLILSFNTVVAQTGENLTLETNYYVQREIVLVEYVFLDLVESLELRVPKDLSNLRVSHDYELIEFDNYNLLIVSGIVEGLSVEYVTSSKIDRMRDKYFFTSINRFSNSYVQEVKLVLPEDAVLDEEGVLFPLPDQIKSDGRSVILLWGDYNMDQIVVSYEFLTGRYDFLWRVFALAILFVFVLYVIYNNLKHKIWKQKKNNSLEKTIRETKKTRERTKEKRKEELTRNLFEDEKKIVEYLFDKKEAWTKEILKDLEISKVKLSRKLRSLEQKEIIKRIPYGNENKIRLLK